MRPAARVYLDTNVFITAYEPKGGTSEEVWWLFDQLERGIVAGFTSELTPAELLTGPLVRRENDLADIYKVLINDAGNLRVVPIDRSILIKAAEIRAEVKSLRLPDAIHLASASLMNCSHLVSGDRRLPSIGGFRHLSLRRDSLSQFRLIFE